MKLKAYQAAFPAKLVVVMVMFLSAIFLANVNLSFAATGKSKSPAVARTSAVDHAEARIKELQGALKITDAQKVSWNNLTRVMRENAINMDALTKERAEKSKTINAVEQMKLHSQLSEVRLEQMKKFIPLFEVFYDSLSAEQKMIADTIFRTGKHGKQKIK